MSERYNLTLLGTLEIVEIYIELDIPLLFLCRNVSSPTNMYLVTQSEDSEERQAWLYAPITLHQLMSLRKRQTPVHDIYKGRGVLNSYRVSYTSTDLEPVVDVVVAEDLRDSELPLKGYFLPEECPLIDLEEILMPAWTAAESGTGRVELWKEHEGRHFLNVDQFFEKDNRLSRQLKCPVMVFKIEFLNGIFAEAPIAPLGGILESLQQLVYAIGQSLTGRPNQRGAFPSDVQDNFQLDAAGFGGGSFAILIRANKSSNLFNESPLDAVLEQISNLLDTGDNIQELFSLVKSMKGRVASSYLDFLNRVSKYAQHVSTDWDSPSQAYPKHSRLSNSSARTASRSLKELVSQESKEISVLGTLVAFDITNNTYALVEEISAKKYSGKVHESILGGKIRLVISGSYYATLEEIEEVTSAGDTKYKYVLIGLEYNLQ